MVFQNSIWLQVSMQPMLAVVANSFVFAGVLEQEKIHWVWGGLTCRPLSVNGGDQRDEGAGRPQSSGCEGCSLENGSYSTSGVDFPNT